MIVVPHMAGLSWLWGVFSHCLWKAFMTWKLWGNHRIIEWHRLEGTQPPYHGWCCQPSCPEMEEGNPVALCLRTVHVRPSLTFILTLRLKSLLCLQGVHKHIFESRGYWQHFFFFLQNFSNRTPTHLFEEKFCYLQQFLSHRGESDVFSLI